MVNFSKQKKILSTLILFTLGMFTSLTSITPQQTVTAAGNCTDLPSDNGHLQSSVDVQTAGNYKVWLRMKTSDSSNKELRINVGNQCDILVGGNAVSADGEWYWTNTTTSNASITAAMDTGSQIIEVAGSNNSTSVGLDRILLLADDSCTPTGTGDNCAVDPDVTEPTVSIQSPSANQTIDETTTINASATDTQSDIQELRLYIDGSEVQRFDTSPISYNWDTTQVTNGSHSIKVEADDTEGNTGQSVITVNVNNVVQYNCADSSADICEDFSTNSYGNFTTVAGTWAAQSERLTISSPASLANPGNGNIIIHSADVEENFTLTTDAQVTENGNDFNDFSILFNYQDENNYQYVQFNESTDDGTNGIFNVSGGTATKVGGFTSNITSDTWYTIEIQRSEDTVTVRLDDTIWWTGDIAPGNGIKTGLGSRNDIATFDNFTITESAAEPPSDQESPTKPTNLNGSANSESSISINWTASTDNVGVVGYEIARTTTSSISGGSSDRTVISATANTTYTDNGLDASTEYRYDVVAIDAAGNRSELSDTVDITTQDPDIEEPVEEENDPGDFNGDGNINLLDFSLLASKFGQSVDSTSTVDMNKDGIINLLDFSLFVVEFRNRN